MSEQNPGCLNTTARGCGHLIQGVLLTVGVVFVIVALFGGAAFGLSLITGASSVFPSDSVAALEAPTAISMASPTQSADLDLVSASAPKSPTLPAVALPTDTPTPTPVPTATPPPTDTGAPRPTDLPATSTPVAVVPVGPTFEEICDVSGFDMTDPQLEAHVANFAGRSFENWRGWVNDVTHYGDTYDLLIAMEPSGGLFWTRDIIVEDIPQDIAFSLSIEDAIAFSGHIARIDTTFDVACNPLYVDQFVLK